jgi:Skp family chaperone for outer membrane proteins
MKKLVFVAVVMSMSTASFIAKAQTTVKFGVFDLELMVQNMPGYSIIDSTVRSYEQDTLLAEREIYESEYKRLDSTYKADSAQGKSSAMLNYTKQQLQQMAFNLIYWQQIAQNKSDQRRAVLSQPLYEKAAAAYKKVLDTKKYSLVLKPNTYELGTQIDNLFPMVCKEMGIPCPPELGGETTQQGAPAGSKTP